LQGDSSTNRQESDKAKRIKLVNIIDRETPNILTYQTGNPERERARKAIAPSFSNTSLYQTWPYIQEGLLEEFCTMRELVSTDTLLDCRRNFLRFTLRILARSAFGVEFTMDGTEDETNINGLEYLRSSDVAMGERVKEFTLPFRRYFFWDKNVKVGAVAAQNLRRITAKMVHLYQTRVQQDGTKKGDNNNRRSIMQHIMGHTYPSDLSRLSDLGAITFAGHDTTGYSLCFLIMELSRNPAVRAKLQAEIATVMPKIPLGRHAAAPATAEGTGTTGSTCGRGDNVAAGINSHKPTQNGHAQTQTQDKGTQVPAAAMHGDPKLLSAICGLEYLTCCIRESFRLWPVAAVASSRTLEEDLVWEYDGDVEGTVSDDPNHSRSCSYSCSDENQGDGGSDNHHNGKHKDDDEKEKEKEKDTAHSSGGVRANTTNTNKNTNANTKRKKKKLVLPKGSSVQAHFFSMFRERWIDDPLTYKPERWLPSNPQLPELKEMFIPFSIGKRACVGQNMAMFQLRLISAYLLHHFDFELVGEPDFEFFLTLKPIGLNVRVTERIAWN